MIAPSTAHIAGIAELRAASKVKSIAGNLADDAKTDTASANEFIALSDPSHSPFLDGL